ncbi:MAG: glycosyltransferase family 4 protein [Proteobacteria bacterium]|nr:glycosyltransferase family 4 protein [Pseudomonadota bacterium]
MKLVWITPKWPFPIEDGARQATTQLLKHLALLGAEIHLCSIIPQGESPNFAQVIQELGIRSVQPVYRKNSSKWRHLKDLLLHPNIPVTIAPYSAKAVSQGVKVFVESHRDAIIVYDGLHPAGWIINAGIPQRQSVYRAHNVERDIWVRAAKEARNPVIHAFLAYQSFLMAIFEKKICASCCVVFPVSSVDGDIFKGMVKGMVKGPEIATLPIGIAPPTGIQQVEFTQGSPRRILFVGRLDWPPNRDGLRWLLEKVWPMAILQAPDLELTIIGSGDGEWLKPYLQLPGVRFLGRAESVAPYYAQSLASIVPIFYGSGTRVKAIESSLHYRPCISTAIGVEGIGVEPGVHYFQAETEGEWADALVNLRPAQAREFGLCAFELARAHFDPLRIAEKFLATTQNLCDGPR